MPSICTLAAETNIWFMLVLVPLRLQSLLFAQPAWTEPPKEKATLVSTPHPITGAQSCQSPAFIDQMEALPFNNSVKWRINRHSHISRLSVVCVKARMYSSVGSLPRTHQSQEMMSCDSNYVKKVDTCKGAANWNQYTSPFIRIRQLINGAEHCSSREEVLLNFLRGWPATGLLHYSESTG